MSPVMGKAAIAPRPLNIPMTEQLAQQSHVHVADQVAGTTVLQDTSASRSKSRRSWAFWFVAH